MKSHQRAGIKSHQRAGINSHQRAGKGSHQRDGRNRQQYERMADQAKLMVIIAVFFTASCFAYASYESSKCIDTENQCQDEEQGFLSKLYFSEKSAERLNLEREVSSDSKGFEFMVWDRERVSLSKELLSLQHRRINLQPLNGELWLELNYLNHTAGVAHAQRSWVLNRSQNIVSWNDQQRAQLVHQCVNEFEVYGQVITSSCIEILVQLPLNKNIGRIATNAKISVERLELARSEALKSQIIEAP